MNIRNSTCPSYDTTFNILKVAVENNDELLDKDTLPVREDFDSFVQEIVRWIKEKQKKYDIGNVLLLPS